MLDDDAGRSGIELDNALCDESEGDEEEDDAVQVSKSTGKKIKKKKGTRAHDNAISKEIGYNRWMRNNIWVVGGERLTTNDIKTTRSNKKKRLKKKDK